MQCEGQYLKRFAIIVPGFLIACSAMFALAGGSLAPAAPVPRAQETDAASRMPDGAGKKIIIEKCQLCHSLELIVISRRDKDDWEALINLMIERGAPLADDEPKTVVNYLAANYGPKGTVRAAPVTNAGAPTPASSVQSMIVDPDQAQFVTPSESMGLPSGVQISMISGDFAKPSLFGALLKLPADQKSIRTGNR